MRTKTIKIRPDRNRYLLTRHGIWVRDLTGPAVPLDINELVSETDYRLLADNELSNATLNLPSIASEGVRAADVLIVSDGHGFAARAPLLARLPRGVTVLGVNRSLAKWPPGVRMDYFVANNPYPECMAMLPAAYSPRCIASTRTFPGFVRAYRKRGLVYRYAPTRDQRFGGAAATGGFVDDYRNPICAAIGLAHRFGVRRLALYCCDDAFDGERPGSRPLANGLHTYPQHDVCHGIVGGLIDWLAAAGVRSANCSDGPEYDGCPYIGPEAVVEFFKRQ